MLFLRYLVPQVERNYAKTTNVIADCRDTWNSFEALDSSYSWDPELRPTTPLPTQGQLEHLGGNKQLDSSGGSTYTGPSYEEPCCRMDWGRTDFQGGCYLTVNINYHAGRFYTIAGHVLRSLPQLPYFKTCEKSAEAIVVCEFDGYIVVLMILWFFHYLFP